MNREHKSTWQIFAMTIAACVFMVFLCIRQSNAVCNGPWAPDATYVNDQGQSVRVMVMHVGRGYFTYRNQDGHVVTAMSGRLERD